VNVRNIIGIQIGFPFFCLTMLISTTGFAQHYKSAFKASAKLEKIAPSRALSNAPRVSRMADGYVPVGIR
jgi:hypothetical protein